LASYQISILYYTKRMVRSRNSTLHPDSVQSRFGSRDKSRLLIFLWFETKFESVWEESGSLTVLCLWFVTLSLCFSVLKCLTVIHPLNYIRMFFSTVIHMVTIIFLVRDTIFLWPNFRLIVL